jgi:hypothetical protein
VLKLHTTCLNIAIDIEPSANFSHDGDSTLPATPQVALCAQNKDKNITARADRFLFIRAIHILALAEGEIAASAHT